MTSAEPRHAVLLHRQAQREGLWRLRHLERLKVQHRLENMAFWAGYDEPPSREMVDHLVALAVQCGFPACEAYRWISDHMRRGAWVLRLEDWLEVRHAA